MDPLAHFCVIDPDSGTFFDANTAMIFDTRWLSEEELETLNEGSDQDRGELALRYGIYLDDAIDAHTLENPAPDAQGGQQ
jgi:hypothetical protein